MFTHSLGAIPNVDDLFHPLEDFIRHSFIPAVTGHLPPSDLDRDFLALPTRIGGMGIINPIQPYQNAPPFT